MPIRPTLQFPKSMRVVTDLRDFFTSIITSYEKGRVSVRITAEAEGAHAANAIRATLQVIDRRGNDVPGLWAIVASVGTTADGVPGGTQTVAAVGGSVPLVANQTLLAITDDTGEAVVDITVAGAGSRYVSAWIDGELVVSAELVWV